MPSDVIKCDEDEPEKVEPKPQEFDRSTWVIVDWDKIWGKTNDYH